MRHMEDGLRSRASACLGILTSAALARGLVLLDRDAMVLGIDVFPDTRLRNQPTTG